MNAASVLSTRTPSVVVVGGGPAGCYTAQFLRKQWPDSVITVVDRLEEPYGLIRYGVAPDHQGTKAVARQFDRLFDRDGVTFAGGTEVGRDVTLDSLRRDFDVVVVATGLYGDRRLGIPGEQLPGVHAAGPLTRFINGHPDERSARYEVGETVVVIGNGNVAVDLVRILAKPADEVYPFDAPTEPYGRLATDHVRRVCVVGRSPAADAKFDAAMIRELGRIDGVRFIVHDLPPAGAEAGAPASRGTLHEALRSLSRPTGSARTTVEFRFGWTPSAFTGATHVDGVAFDSSSGDGRTLSIAADTVITAIGFEAHENDTALLRDRLLSPRSDLDRGRLDRDLYCVGWYRRGATGTIPENRTDARSVAGEIIAAFDRGEIEKARHHS